MTDHAGLVVQEARFGLDPPGKVAYSQACGMQLLDSLRWAVGRLVILSGPSCVGKGPLYAALKKFYPDVAGAMTRFVLYDSRAPRPGEVEGPVSYTHLTLPTKRIV